MQEEKNKHTKKKTGGREDRVKKSIQPVLRVHNLKLLCALFYKQTWGTGRMKPEHAKLQIVSKLSTTRRKCPNYLFVEQNRTNISILARATNVHGSSLGD